MGEKKNYGKIILAIVFAGVIFVVGGKSHIYEDFGKMCRAVISEIKYQEKEEEALSESDAALDEDVQVEEATFYDVKTEFTDSIYKKAEFINLNGTMARKLNMRGYYGQDGIFVADNGYIIRRSKKASTDYEFDNICKLKSYLDERGINLLYVNAPVKYTDDSFYENQFGRESYINRNADLFLQRISDVGIDCIDLRKKAEEDNLDNFEMFYRTDHHWTTRSGFWAAETVAETLNEKCGYQIDLSLYEKDKYTFTDFHEIWLGEQGRKIGESYIGLDDYTLIKPKFDTSYVLSTRKGVKEGSFDIMMDESRVYSKDDVYQVPSLHYTYFPERLNEVSIHNNDAAGGDMLLLCDSYSNAVLPFLSLGISDISSLLMREYNPASLFEFIEKNKFDTVVILYAEQNIGAHDSPGSANYDMFTFN